MQLPPPDPDPVCEDLLQDLPAATIAMAYAFKAFTRARPITTPQQLLRAVFLSCGRDHSLRAVAGTMTVRVQRLTDSASAARLVACRPWGKALLPTMRGPRPLAALPPGWRCIVIDGSTVQVPGATSLPYRLPLGLGLGTLECTQVRLSEAKTGESLRHVALGPPGLAVADRGDCHPTAVAETVHAGAPLVVRRNPYTMPLCQPDGTPLAMVPRLPHQAPWTVRRLPGRVGPPTPRVAGWGQA